jgi:hypothetical protein
MRHVVVVVVVVVVLRCHDRRRRCWRVPVRLHQCDKFAAAHELSGCVDVARHVPITCIFCAHLLRSSHARTRTRTLPRSDARAQRGVHTLERRRRFERAQELDTLTRTQQLDREHDLDIANHLQTLCGRRST